MPRPGDRNKFGQIWVLRDPEHGYGIWRETPESRRALEEIRESQQQIQDGIAAEKRRQNATLARNTISPTVTLLQMQNCAKAYLELFEMNGMTRYFPKDELYESLICYVKRYDGMFFESALEESGSCWLGERLDLHRESLFKAFSDQLQKSATVLHCTFTESMRYWINDNLSFMPTIKIENPQYNIDVAIRNTARAITSLVKPIDKIAFHERYIFEQQVKKWLEEQRKLFQIYIKYEIAIPPHRKFIDEFLGRAKQANRNRLPLEEHLAAWTPTDPLYADNALDFFVSSAKNTEEARKLHVQSEKERKLQAQRHKEWTLACETKGRNIAIKEQKEGAIQPKHWRCQPRDPDEWQGYRDQWVTFLKIRNKAFPSSGWSASKAQNMRSPHSHFVFNVKAWAAGIGAGLIMVYGSNFLTTRATVVSQTSVSAVAQTPVTVIVPSGGAPVVTPTVPTTSVPIVTPVTLPGTQKPFDVTLVTQPGKGCTFNWAGIPIVNGKTIRFTSNVPATVTLDENVLNSWPLPLPAKKRSFPVNGETVLKINYPNHWLPLRPDIKFTCETPSVSGTAHGNPLHVYRSR